MRVPLDVRHALRSLQRHWKLTLAATTTLGLGIGAALTMAAAGVGIALAGGRVMASLLYGIATSDAAAIGGAVVIFTFVALAAILVATRGAARTDPMVILRAD